MTEKRYYKKDYDELYYIFDSKTLSEKEFEEKVEYDGYDVFADSLTSKEVVDLLNELHEENQKLLTLSNMKKGALVEAVKDLIKENEQLKQQLADIDKLIDDLGHNEMQRQYEEIIKQNVEDD